MNIAHGSASSNTQGNVARVIGREQAKRIILAQRGKFFAVDFIKKNGEARTLNGRRGVRKHLRGGEMRYNPSEHGLLIVWDKQKRDYRAANMRTMTGIRAGGVRYIVNGD